MKVVVSNKCLLQRLYPQLNLEPIENAYGTSGYKSGMLRVAFIRGNENLKTKSGDLIDGRKLMGGGVLVSREKFRDLWMRVRYKYVMQKSKCLTSLSEYFQRKPFW